MNTIYAYIKNLRINLWLFLTLFFMFFFYRIYFWGNYSSNLFQASLNAFADAVFSYSTGVILYYLRSIYNNQKLKMYLISILVFGMSIGMVYLFHVFIYKKFYLFEANFIQLFNSICFQLLDSVAIIFIGAFAVVINNMQIDKLFYNAKILELNQEKLQSELKYLKAQLDPHFVFNSLNTIYYQINDGNLEAKKSIAQFSDIMRYHIQKSSLQKVPLKEEIEYIKSFIDFQTKRKSDFLTVNSVFDLDKNDFEVEPLLLMPLIENAFKFVNSEGLQKGNIYIKAEFKSNRFDFIIKNTYPKEMENSKGGMGIGLNNVMKRLEILYKNTHEFSIQNNKRDGLFTCNLRLWKMEN